MTNLQRLDLTRNKITGTQTHLMLLSFISPSFLLLSSSLLIRIYSFLFGNHYVTAALGDRRESTVWHHSYHLQRPREHEVPQSWLSRGRGKCFDTSQLCGTLSFPLSCSSSLFIYKVRERRGEERERVGKGDRSEFYALVLTFMFCFLSILFLFSLFTFFFLSLFSPLYAACSLQHLDGDHRPYDLLLHDPIAVPQSRLQRVLGSLACGDR